MAPADHLVGFCALTVIAQAAAEVSRPVRYCLIPLGASTMVTPFLFGADATHSVASIVVGSSLIALSFRRGEIRERYGSRDRCIV